MDDDLPPISIQGCPVYFPYKAYGSQMSMMSRIMQSLVKKQNCLLESPTGSGKTLSLLCSTLGWLTREIENREKKIEELTKKCQEEEDVPMMLQDCCTRCSFGAVNVGAPRPKPKSKDNVPKMPSSSAGKVKEMKQEVKQEVKQEDEVAESKVPSSSGWKGKRIKQEVEEKEEEGELKTEADSSSHSPASKRRRFHDDECDDDFKESSFDDSYSHHDEKVASTSIEDRVKVLDDSDTLGGKELEDKSYAESYLMCEECPCHMSEPQQQLEQVLREKIPKVFYGTRTHNQITQLIREVKKTKYQCMNSTILSSRNHSCVNDYVRRQTKMNEVCRELVSNSECPFHTRVPRINTHRKLVEEVHLDGAFDIEELVFAAKEVGACPYYTAREIIASANIIFCPYNYLLEPSFRSAIGLNLTGHIIIFDEAHNIETTACDAVSFDITKDQLEKAKIDFEGLIKRKIKVSDHQALLDMINNMLKVMDLTRSRLIRQDFEGASLVWTGPEIIAFLEQVGLGPTQLSSINKHLLAVSATQDKRDEMFVPKRKKKEPDHMETSTSILLESLFLCLGIMFKDNMKYSSDYRVALIESISYEKASEEEQPERRGSWLSKRRRSAQSGGLTQRTELTLHFWCLSPAVAFDEIAKQARTIILTSGTLSPLNSFASEMAVEFPLRLEANHVVRNDQTFVAAVGAAPNGGKLCATFQYYETFRFQDDLGSLILHLCKTVPHGVLCFVASYTLAEKLMKRWEDTGMLDELRQVKHVAVEPRKVADMPPVLEGYYDAVSDTASGPTAEGRTGAFMMAVCRGKMSEGQDFADQNARLVITVGIPYPNVKITKISLKRSYNDEYHKTRNLLTGSQWYEVQAFRALNQALGRCIRHRNDWGAVIMVDVRLCDRADRYIPSVSKWLRQRVELFPASPPMLRRLADFVARRKEVEQNGEVVTHPRKAVIVEEEEAT